FSSQHFSLRVGSPLSSSGLRDAVISLSTVRTRSAAKYPMKGGYPRGRRRQQCLTRSEFRPRSALLHGGQCSLVLVFLSVPPLGT
ncbi:hypothetical protein PFISCL1PPCAC_12885, partial [Pristionchus fissidentatus]